MPLFSVPLKEVLEREACVTIEAESLEDAEYEARMTQRSQPHLIQWSETRSISIDSQPAFLIDQ